MPRYRAWAWVFIYLLLNPHPVYPLQCENSDSWHVVAGLVDCVDDADWVKRNKPHGGRCDWVAKDPEGRCKKKSKDKVKASEACECACGSLGGTAAPTAEPGASFSGADTFASTRPITPGFSGESVSIVTSSSGREMITRAEEKNNSGNL